MDVNQCSYCGVTAYMEADACPSCQEAMGQTAAVPETIIENSSENTPSFSNAEPFPQIPSDESFPQNSETQNFAAETQAEFLPETTLPTRQSSTSDWKRCPICNAGIAQYRDVCSRCATVNKPVKQKSGFGKFVFILLILGLFGGGIYYFINGSKLAIVRKYEKATGSSGAMGGDSFVMKGSASMVIQPVMSVGSPGYQGYGSAEKYKKEESFLFDFSFKNPNKSLIDFYKFTPTGNQSAIKQGFNGTSGWKYTNIFNQPEKYENADNGFSDDNFGAGLGDYQALSELNEASKAEFAPAIGYFRDLVKTFEVDGNKKDSNSKAYLVSTKKKADGKTEKALLVFDEESGFLIGMSKTDLINNKPVTTIGLFSRYSKFWVKEKGFLGLKSKFVSIPTSWKIIVGELEALAGTGNLTFTMNLNIESITMDVPLEDSIFEKPAGK